MQVNLPDELVFYIALKIKEAQTFFNFALSCRQFANVCLDKSLQNYKLNEFLTHIEDGDNRKYSILPNGKRHSVFEKYFEDYGTTGVGERVLRKKCTYNFGVLVGEYTEYYYNGVVSIQCMYNENGEINGQFREWTISGRIYKECTYVNDKIEGILLKWYPNGRQRKTCHYHNGNLNGSYSSFYSNGRPKKRCHYVSGKLFGDFVKFFPSGQLDCKQWYYDSVRVGEQNQWWENGNIREKYICDEAGKLNGDYQRWHRNGRIEAKAKYLTGQRHGSYRIWDQYGFIVMDHFYTYGIENGEWRQWYGYRDSTDNQLWIDATYSNGHLINEYREYYESSKLKVKCVYNEDGVIEGSYEEYYDNGNIRRYICYKNGQVVGKRMEWSRNGTLKFKYE
jgi:uncharacterized protein